MGRLELLEDDRNRPLHVVIASIFEDFKKFALEESPKLAPYLAGLDELAAEAEGLKPADRVLLRNQVKEGFVECDVSLPDDEGPLEAATLLERTPDLFPSADALYQRNMALKERMAESIGLSKAPKMRRRKRSMTMAELIEETSDEIGIKLLAEGAEGDDEESC